MFTVVFFWFYFNNGPSIIMKNSLIFAKFSSIFIKMQRTIILVHEISNIIKIITFDLDCCYLFRFCIVLVVIFLFSLNLQMFSGNTQANTLIIFSHVERTLLLSKEEFPAFAIWTVIGCMRIIEKLSAIFNLLLKS